MSSTIITEHIVSVSLFCNVRLYILWQSGALRVLCLDINIVDQNVVVYVAFGPFIGSEKELLLACKLYTVCE